jgi:hypothetical protein
MFFFLSTEMLFKAITKQSLLWDRLFLALVLRKVNHCIQVGCRTRQLVDGDAATT